MLIKSSKINCQTTNSCFYPSPHICKVKKKKERKSWYGARPWVWKSQGSCRYYVFKSRRLKLSNLWAAKCPCGTQEILKVEGKVEGKKKLNYEIIWHVPQRSEQGHCSRARSPPSRLPVTLLCTAGGGVLQHEQQHLCVCCHCGTSSAPPSSLPLTRMQIWINASFCGSVVALLPENLTLYRCTWTAEASECCLEVMSIFILFYDMKSVGKSIDLDEEFTHSLPFTHAQRSRRFSAQTRIQDTWSKLRTDHVLADLLRSVSRANKGLAKKISASSFVKHEVVPYKE